MGGECVVAKVCEVLSCTVVSVCQRLFKGFSNGTNVAAEPISMRLGEQLHAIYTGANASTPERQMLCKAGPV